MFHAFAVWVAGVYRNCTSFLSEIKIFILLGSVEHRTKRHRTIEVVEHNHYLMRALSLEKRKYIELHAKAYPTMWLALEKKKSVSSEKTDRCLEYNCDLRKPHSQKLHSVNFSDLKGYPCRKYGHSISFNTKHGLQQLIIWCCNYAFTVPDKNLKMLLIICYSDQFYTNPVFLPL